MKQCNNIKCAQINPQSMDMFYRDKSRKDGLHPSCKYCHNIRVKLYQNTPAGKAVLAKKNLIYRNTSHGKSKLASHTKKYRQTVDGRSRTNAKNVSRQASKIQRTPKWLTKEHHEQIQAIYLEAIKKTQETGIKHHVDHIEPLQGKDRSGLHVPWNLQVLTASENCSKGNR